MIESYRLPGLSVIVGDVVGEICNGVKVIIQMIKTPNGIVYRFYCGPVFSAVFCSQDFSRGCHQKVVGQVAVDSVNNTFPGEFNSFPNYPVFQGIFIISGGNNEQRENRNDGR